MKQPTIAPYGAWKSVISAEAIAAGSIGLNQLQADGRSLFWIESRPMEKGRCIVLQHTADGRITDRTAASFNVRSRVNEYGGGAYIADRGVLYFVNLADQRIYRQERGHPPMPLTPEATGMRYADLFVDRFRRRLLAIREDHSRAGQEPAQTIVALSTYGFEAGQLLVSGQDFYSSPRLSPDGTRLAWIAWNHPQMPWDATELWIGRLDAAGNLAETLKIAGGPGESVQQPAWSPAGDLHFISDRTGWWNLYRWRQGCVEPLCPCPFEMGTPPWVFGLSTYDFLSNTQILCSLVENGQDRLAILDAAEARLQRLEIEFTAIDSLKVCEGKAVFLGASPTRPLSVVELDPRTAEFRIVRQPVGAPAESDALSIPVAIEFPVGKDECAHAFFYPAGNPCYLGPPGQRPPLLVKSHGGPTSAASTRLNLGIQYWTSRGFAVLDVNYRGSTGFGRAYREKLNGEWGVADVEDCIQGARYLVSEGLVDPRRMAITGGSAGGFTTLCALAFHQVFSAGSSYYGVSDLESLVRDTHKFESRYLDSLIAPYPARRDLYAARSPIHSADRMNCPVILFQGLDDPVVPPDQAEKMAAAMRQRGLPVACLTFEGEQHGFRRAENIRRCLEAELYFYSRIFGFPLADNIEPVLIENLDAIPRRAGDGG